MISTKGLLHTYQYSLVHLLCLLQLPLVPIEIPKVADCGNVET
jgi:hypothetical protein